MSCDDPEDTSPPALWEAAKYLLRWLYAICGTPCAIVADGLHAPRERRRIALWLRPVEALVRRLLVVEAVRMAQTLPAAEGKGTGARPRQRPPMCRIAFLDPEDSDAWIVHFRALGGTPMRHAEGNSPQAPESERRSGAPAARRKDPLADWCPWPLAVRIEAVTRVLRDPEPYARRLAWRLRKDAGPIRRACRPPPPRIPGKRQRYGDEPLRLANEHALAALAPFDTS